MRSNNEENSKGPRIAARALGLALLAGLAPLGCAKDNPPEEPEPAPVTELNNDAFAPEGEIHATDRFTEAQAARGALKDGMLYSHHFDGPELNSLGMTKLNLMLQKNPAGRPMVVYLNTGSKDDYVDDRQVAVEAFVAASEYTATTLEVRKGPNLDNSRPSAEGIASLPKTDTAANRGGSGGTRGANGAGTSVGEGGGGGGGSR